MRKQKIARLAFASALLLLGFVGTTSANTCSIVDNFCSSCTGGKVRSCDRYCCIDSLTGKCVYHNECTACGFAC